MKNLSVFFLVCSIFVLSTCEDQNVQDQQIQIQDIDTVSCEDWAEIMFDDYVVSNNVWNKGSITNYTQCIFREEEDGQIQFGWEWNWPSSGWDVKSYPEIIFGHKPWSLSSTTPSLPLKISDVQSISITLESDLVTSGSCNLAFDIWITDTDEPSEDVINKEIMIWLTNNELMPAGEKIATVLINEINYDLFQYFFEGWEYLAFLAHEPTTTSSIQLELFLNTLIDFQLLEDTEFIASIELGNEIVDGAGIITIESYGITVVPSQN